MIAAPQCALEIGDVLPLRAGLHVAECRITDVAQVDGAALYLVRFGALEFWLNEQALRTRAEGAMAPCREESRRTS